MEERDSGIGIEVIIVAIYALYCFYDESRTIKLHSEYVLTA